MERMKQGVRLAAHHIDTCLPSFWGGHPTPHIQVTVHRGMTFGELKAELISELNNGPVMGSDTPQEDDEVWFAAARLAVSELALTAEGGDDQTPMFMDLEEDSEDGQESVYAYFLFMEE